jgi:hypothetical protein
VQDWHFDEPDFAGKMRKKVNLTKRMGGGYVSFQVWLSNEHQDTGGAYRRDEEYLTKVARRIDLLHAICFEEGLNCYVRRSPPRRHAPSPWNAFVVRLPRSTLLHLLLVSNPDC